MRALWKSLILATLLVAGPEILAQGASADPCVAKVPASLRESIAAKYPGFRIAGLSDYLPEDIERHKKNFNGDPCLSVAAADVDGDGVKDYGLIITDASLHTLLVGARNTHSKGWTLATLKDFGSQAPGRLYVSPLGKGTFESIHAASETAVGATPETGRVSSYKATHGGFFAGAIQATRVAYFFNGKEWVHLYLSD